MSTSRSPACRAVQEARRSETRRNETAGESGRARPRTLSLVLLPILPRLRARQYVFCGASPSCTGHSNGSRSQKTPGASKKWYFALATRATSSRSFEYTASGVRDSGGASGLAERSGSEDGQACVRSRSTGFGAGGGGRTEAGLEGGAGERAEIASATWLAVNGWAAEVDSAAADAAGASGQVPATVAIRSPDASVSTPALAAGWGALLSRQQGTVANLDLTRDSTHGGHSGSGRLPRLCRPCPAPWAATARARRWRIPARAVCTPR